MKYLIYLFMACIIVLIVNNVSALKSGINYYSTESYDYTTQTGYGLIYQLGFVMDDIGTSMNTPAIADIDNDGVNEMIHADYYGKLQVWNWSGMKMGLYESIDTTDRGTYYVTTAMGDHIIGGDNNGNGCLEMAVNDYNGYMRVLEYCGGTWTQIFVEPSDRGYYRNSPEWCDIDGDGDMDIFTCDYSGVCRLYTYYNGAYSLNFTDSDRGSFNIGNSPTCGNYSNSAQGNGLIALSYEGYMYVYNYTLDSKLEMVWSDSSDRGTYYGEANIGTYMLNDNETNYVITYADGKSFLYNCSEGGTAVCTYKDVSADLGNTVYTSVIAKEGQINGNTYLFNTVNIAHVVYTYVGSDMNLYNGFVGLNLLGTSYANIGIPSDGDGDTNYILYTTRMKGDVGIMKRTSQTDFTTWVLYNDIQSNYYSDNYHYGFYYTGFSCGQLNYDTPEDECVIVSYYGIPFIFTLQNITEFDVSIADEYEIALLDIMPRTATAYIPKGSNKAYCVNEDENIFYHGIYSTNTNRTKGFIKAVSNSGGAVSEDWKITDGKITTDGTYKHKQLSDAVNYGIGSDVSIWLNFSMPVYLGALKFWWYYSNGNDVYNLRINISSEPCTYPDTNINYVSVFDEKDGDDITGSPNSDGITVRFTPQFVRCIKITSDGYYYFSTGLGYSSNNYIAELQGFYANDCTFYYVPMEDRNATPSNYYNVTFNIEELYEKGITQQTAEAKTIVTNYTQSVYETINKWIIKRK